MNRAMQTAVARERRRQRRDRRRVWVATLLYRVARRLTWNIQHGVGRVRQAPGSKIGAVYESPDGMLSVTDAPASDLPALSVLVGNAGRGPNTVTLTLAQAETFGRAVVQWATARAFGRPVVPPVPVRLRVED